MLAISQTFCGNHYIFSKTQIAIVFFNHLHLETTPVMIMFSIKFLTEVLSVILECK